jgi:hypothetical protein
MPKTNALTSVLLLAQIIGQAWLTPAQAAQPGMAAYYVAPDGIYANPGTEAAPTTLEGARDKIRALGSLPMDGVTIYLRGGIYERTETFELTSADSSDSAHPVTYRAYPGEAPRISGGRQLDPAWFSLVTDASPIWDRLDPTAQGQIWQVDLDAHGIDDYGTLVRRGYSADGAIAALELAFNGEMMELARWPNRGHSDPFDETANAVISGELSPDITGNFEYIGAHASGDADDSYPNYRRVGLVGGQQFYLYHCTWVTDTGAHKYWFISAHDPLTDPDCWPDSGPSWLVDGDDPRYIPPLEEFGSSSGLATARTHPEDYAAHGFVRIPEVTGNTTFRLPGARYQRWSQAEDIWFQGLFGSYWADDTLSGTIDGAGFVTLAAEPSYGLGYMHPFAVLNLLEEIDTPGEWYLDRGTGWLYFWPPESLSNSDISVSLLEAPLLHLTGTTNTHFEGLTFELGRSDLVQVQAADGVRFEDCTFRNTGGEAVNIDGINSGLAYATIYGTGGGGASLSGGSRPALVESNNYVSNSAIHHFGRWERTYNPGVQLSGCGNVVEHNEIRDAPHAAILFSGNEHRIRYNEIGYVVQEANDAGAIYAGRDWGYRGNQIEYNLIHHVESVFGGSHGVYLDDAVSGMRVFGNIFYHIRGLATLSGGGRDNLTENNIIFGAEHAHGTDRRARNYANNDFGYLDRPDDWNLLGRINVVYETYYNDYPDVQSIDYQHGAWAAHYPNLAAIPNDWSQVDGSHWLEPEGSTFTCNDAWQIDALYSLGNMGGGDPLAWYAESENNLEADPLFVDENNLNLALRPESPVYSQLPCFQEIPFDQIGIHEEPALALNGQAADQQVYLNWTVNVTLPPTTTWTLTYAGPPGDQNSPITGIPEPTRTYTLTGLTNHAWYTITLATDPPVLTDTVTIMPTSHIVYLPTIARNR